MLLTLLLACAPTDEDTFWNKFAQVTCSRAQECSKGAFDAEWDGDVAECVEDYVEAFEDDADYYDGCEFDKGKADDCLKQMGSDSCGDLYEDGVDDCGEVWDCDDRVQDSGWW